MRTNGELQRQALGCGYLPPADGRVHLTIWQPPRSTSKSGYHGPELTVCAGYTANLPEVIETALARAAAKHNAIGFVSEGGPPTEDLLHAVMVLDSEYSSLESWLMTPSKDGGGGS